MDVIFQIAEHLPEISRLHESSLPTEIYSPMADQSSETYVDVDEERRQYLLDEARSAATSSRIRTS